MSQLLKKVKCKWQLKVFDTLHIYTDNTFSKFKYKDTLYHILVSEDVRIECYWCGRGGIGRKLLIPSLYCKMWLEYLLLIYPAQNSNLHNGSNGIESLPLLVVIDSEVRIYFIC